MKISKNKNSADLHKQVPCVEKHICVPPKGRLTCINASGVTATAVASTALIIELPHSITKEDEFFVYIYMSCL